MAPQPYENPYFKWAALATIPGDHGQSFFTIDTHGQAVGTVIRYFIRAYAGTVHANYYVRVSDIATHHAGYVLEVMT